MKQPPPIKTKDKFQYLYQLGTFVEFTYRKRKYRTIAPIRYSHVNRAKATNKREVICLETNKAVRLPYYARVVVD